MNKLTLSRYTKELILDGFKFTQPFEKIGHQTFLKFDQIVFDSPSGKVTFLYAGKEVFFFRPESYQEGMMIHVIGIEGRMGCSFTD